MFFNLSLLFLDVGTAKVTLDLLEEFTLDSNVSFALAVVALNIHVLQVVWVVAYLIA